MGVYKASTNLGEQFMIRYVCKKDLFSNIPGMPIAYWVSSNAIDAFLNNDNISSVAQPRLGFATGDNDRFMREWYELSFDRIGIGFEDRESAKKSGKKWFPTNKGGESRKWYGNISLVVNWENDGEEIRNFRDKNGKLRSRPQNLKECFSDGVSWTVISNNNSFRFSPKGMLYNNKGPILGHKNDEDNLVYLALLNSIVATYFLRLLSPTLGFESGYIGSIPYCVDETQKHEIRQLSKENIKLSKNEWDCFEFSWEFKKNPLLGGNTLGRLISDKFEEWKSECQDRFNKIKANEEKLNALFINIYGLQDELTSEVDDKDVTVRLADKERDIRSLISYLIGVAMGRYSLDVPGLAYAGGEWDKSKYLTYQPDDDGIIPIYNGIGMEDGLTTVLINLIKQIYGEDTYRQNIDFIAEALGKNNNESSEETLNRYLNDGFYADHLKVYQKRPIYWLFTSGKKAGFKCLIYLHRYNEDTLARINAKYFLPESTRKKSELEELNGKIARAEGRDKLKLEKQRQNLAAAYNEAIEYGQVLDHMANQYISIDLDDGVKVNYAKFQGVEIVTDGGSKVKKDLLAPLK